MTFAWPVGKLDLCNSAFVLTGCDPVAVLDDGSDRWEVASAAYEDGLAVLCEEANWGFITKVATLTPSPTAPADTAWDTAYLLPADLIHIVWVRVNQATNPISNTLGRLALYDILKGQLVVNAQGGPPPPSTPQPPRIVTMKYASMDNADPVNGTPLFVRALKLYVMSGLYRGLIGDLGEGDKTFAAAEVIARRARTRYDQQKPKRQLWNSRISAARRMRHPCPPVGNNSWGGTGGGG